MNYILAKQLKDAGFPQEHNPMAGPVAYESSDFNGSKEWASAPTLEELIEACGARFRKLYCKSTQRWDAYARPEPLMDAAGNAYPMVRGSAPSPTEAVARLWLSLNKSVES